MSLLISLSFYGIFFSHLISIGRRQVHGGWGGGRREKGEEGRRRIKGGRFRMEVVWELKVREREWESWGDVREGRGVSVGKILW